MCCVLAICNDTAGRIGGRWSIVTAAAYCYPSGLPCHKRSFFFLETASGEAGRQLSDSVLLRQPIEVPVRRGDIDSQELLVDCVALLRARNNGPSFGGKSIGNFSSSQYVAYMRGLNGIPSSCCMIIVWNEMRNSRRAECTTRHQSHLSEPATTENSKKSAPS